jgi:hypothetical protein
LEAARQQTKVIQCMNRMFSSVARASTCDRVKARNERFWLKRRNDVVVCSKLNALDAVAFIFFGGHQNNRSASGRSQVVQTGHVVAFDEHSVEQNRVEGEICNQGFCCDDVIDH